MGNTKNKFKKYRRYINTSILRAYFKYLYAAQFICRRNKIAKLQSVRQKIILQAFTTVICMLPPSPLACQLETEIAAAFVRKRSIDCNKHFPHMRLVTGSQIKILTGLLYADCFSISPDGIFKRCSTIPRNLVAKYHS